MPPLDRPELLEPHFDLLRDLYKECKGNLVRVHEKLGDQNIKVSYQTVTSTFRRHELVAAKEKRRAGRYVYEPGKEMQHDTSPHRVVIAGRERLLTCASLVLAYSTVRFARCYERWSRLETKDFLSRAIQFIGGAAEQCMVDNCTLIMKGTGARAVAVPEMDAFSRHFGFKFIAHEVGDTNRSAPVERPFDHIERNFYPGRTFESLDDLNEQFVVWLQKRNATFNRDLQASPAELFRAEQHLLKPLPGYIPEVYELHSRRVDTGGFVNLLTNRYSVDAKHIGTSLEVRETIDRVRIYAGPRLLEEHIKEPFGAHKRVLLDKHKCHRPTHKGRVPPSEEELLLCKQGPDFASFVAALKKRHGGQALRAVKRLTRLWQDYQSEAVNAAITKALSYGLTDLDRLERLILRTIAGDFFKLPIEGEDDDGS